MFEIDRKYIQYDTLEETLQSRIIYIRSKYKKDPALPQPDAYGISGEQFEEYIDKKQDLTEWQRTMRKKGPVALAILFCVPPVAVSFYDRGDAAFFLSFLASIVLAACAFIIFKGVCKARERSLANDNCEAYIEELLKWYDKKKLEELV